MPPEYYTAAVISISVTAVIMFFVIRSQRAPRKKKEPMKPIIMPKYVQKSQ